MFTVLNRQIVCCFQAFCRVNMLHKIFRNSKGLRNVVWNCYAMQSMRLLRFFFRLEKHWKSFPTQICCKSNYLLRTNICLLKYCNYWKDRTHDRKSTCILRISRVNFRLHVCTTVLFQLSRKRKNIFHHHHAMGIIKSEEKISTGFAQRWNFVWSKILELQTSERKKAHDKWEIDAISDFVLNKSKEADVKIIYEKHTHK